MNKYLDVSPEVQEALAAGKPIVALESTIISHGMPYPKNVETALLVEQTIRDNGAVPATIAVIGGRLKAGLTHEEIEYLGKTGRGVAKASRRDLPALIARRADGATTVATTMIIAHLAGIRIFATGGIGGVHRGAEVTMDISADLEELAQTPVMVVCAGAKSILDLGLTLEYLETKGVPVIGYGTEELPAFYTRQSGFGVDYRVDSPEELAAMFRAQRELDYKGGMLVTNPIPEEYSMDKALIDAAIDRALKEAEAAGVKGKEVTPFLLAKVVELTGGDSLESNIQLVLNNARLAARTAARRRSVRTGKPLWACLFFSWGLPEGEEALIVALLQRDQHQRAQQHPPDAAQFPADVDAEQGGQRIQTDLVAQKLGLGAAAHQVEQRPAEGQTQRPAAPTQQQTVERPGQQDRACPEHRQSVYQRRQGRQTHRLLHPEQQEGEQQLKKGHGHQNPLGPEEAAEAAAQLPPQLLQAPPLLRGDLRLQKREQTGEGGRDKIGADPEGRGEEQQIRAVLGQTAHRVQRALGEERRHAVQALRQTVQRRVQQLRQLRRRCVDIGHGLSLQPVKLPRQLPHQRRALPGKFRQRRETPGAQAAQSQQHRAQRSEAQQGRGRTPPPAPPDESPHRDLQQGRQRESQQKGRAPGQQKAHAEPDRRHRDAHIEQKRKTADRAPLHALTSANASLCFSRSRRVLYPVLVGTVCRRAV